MDGVQTRLSWVIPCVIIHDDLVNRALIPLEDKLHFFVRATRVASISQGRLLWSRPIFAGLGGCPLFLAKMFAQSVFPFHNLLMFLRGIPPQRGASCDSEMGRRRHRHGHCSFDSPSSPPRDSRGNRDCGLCADYAHEQPGVCHTDHFPAEDNVEPLRLFELRSVGFGEHPLLR